MDDAKYALRWCNGLRKKCGAGATSRLSKGRRNVPGLCPIAITLEKVGVREAAAGTDEFVDHVWLRGRKPDNSVGVIGFQDERVAQFIRDFDDGRYPELERPKPELKVAGKVVA